VQGHREEPALAAALDQVAGETLWLRVFGSYPRWQGPRPSSPAAD
jgi:prephenate dehydratase